MTNEQIIIRGKTGDKDIRPESVKPTIIIGIGGSGGDVLLRIRKRFYEKYGALQQFPIVSYIWIDTDATDKAIPNSAAISEQIAFANNEKVMTTIADTTKYTSDLNTYPHIKQWFYPGLSKLKTMNEGAGQIRAYSRLGFFDHFSDIRQTILNAAARVRNVENIKAARDRHNLDVDPSNLQVFVVFSVAGGTGSGMFLDVAFLVKDIFKGEKLTNVGVVMMPGLFNPTEDRVFANGYAALKELEHYSYEHDFVVQWPDGFKRKIEGPPFNYAYLIDRTNSASQSVEFANRDTIFNMVAENIFRDFTQGDFAGYKRGVRVNLDQYMYDTFGFGHLNDRGESVLDQKFRTRYGSFGMASITVPADRIEQACAYKLAADVVDHWGSLSNSGYNAAMLIEVVLQKLMPKVHIYEGALSVDGKMEERRDIQATLLDDGRKQGQRMDQFIDQAITQAGRELRDGVHKQRNQEMAHYMRVAVDRELIKLRNDHPDPQQWGDYSRAVHFNKEALSFDAQQRLRGEVNAIINEQHQSVGYAIALLRRLADILRHENHAYIPKFERSRDQAIKRADEAKRDLEQLYAEVARHERKWNIPGTGQKKAILEADTERFERLAPVYLGNLLKAQAHNAAIEFCHRLIEYIGVAETNDKGEQINEGLIGHLFTLGGQLEELRARLLERYAHFRQAGRGELSLYLYDESDIEGSYLPKYLGADEKKRRQQVESIGDQILQELNTTVVDLPPLVRELGMGTVEARIRELARVPFYDIKNDFDVIEAFWRRYTSEAAREREVRFVYRNAKFWLGGGNRGRSYPLQSERHKIIVGIPEETKDKSKLAEFEKMLRGKFPEQGDPTPSIYKLTDRSEVVFYSEVGGIPINWADTVAELRRKYLKKQAEGEELHTDRNEIQFEDLVVLEDDERREFEDAHECFLLGLIFGEIWPDPDNTGRTQYKWRKRRNIVSKEISLGIEPRALAELISKSQTRQDIFKEINRRLERVYNDRDALARFNALLAWYSTKVYPDQKRTGGDGQEYIEMSNMGRAVNKYMDKVTDHVEAQERRGQGTEAEFNSLSGRYFDSIEEFTDRLYDGKRALRAEAVEPSPAVPAPAPAIG
jgi:hypothetical protein